MSAAAIADPPEYDRARAAAHFGGVARDLVHGLKYADRQDVCRLLARWLVMAGEPLLRHADLLLPVPLHRWRLFHRRFNQAALLADHVADLTGVPSEPLALVRVKATSQQVGLTREQRRSNMVAAFEVPPDAVAVIDGRNVVVVDDVITTGATVNACAKALKRAGAASVDVIAVAMALEGETERPRRRETT